MNVKKNPLDNFKRFLLNRSSTSTPFVEFLEHCMTTEDEAANYCFHKVMVHGWTDSKVDLYDTFSDYFTSPFIPIAGTTQAGISSFYTSSLSFINKIIRYDFMFPYQQNMFNIDILFNDKTSTELFDNHVTLDDIVGGVVSRRFTDKCELDLSNFCNDQEFAEKNIAFYKMSLLGHFKILMLRMGRDTKSLNLSNNEMSQPPIEILNFFIKGDLTSINLSNNNITSISDLFRVSSKIEKLWVEGNPLCEEIEPSLYVKSITMKFPRLSELDGVRINETGLHFPFVRNYLEPNERSSKMLAEKFLTVYFTHFDAPLRPDILGFYESKPTLTITTGFTTSEEIEMSKYSSHSRNILTENRSAANTKRVYVGLQLLKLVLCDRLPATIHDPSTFTVDVLHHDRKLFLIVVSGIFKERDTPDDPSRVFHFRRTFAFTNNKRTPLLTYTIANEMIHITTATPQQLKNCFKNPIRNHNSLALMNPEREESEAIVKVFTYITQLKKEEAEIRLRLHKWDMREALHEFVEDIAKNNIHYKSFVEDDLDDLSDMSSLMDEDTID